MGYVRSICAASSDSKSQCSTSMWYRPTAQEACYTLR